eukprot:4005555-Pleurochrysis_carterae.AAC.3
MVYIYDIRLPGRRCAVHMSHDSIQQAHSLNTKSRDATLWSMKTTVMGKKSATLQLIHLGGSARRKKPKMQP